MQLLIISFIAWFIAQLVKFSIRSFDGRPDPKLLYQSGGMPSAHVATVVALVMATLTTQGWASPVFGVVTVIAAIVVYDSLGVRRASGEQSIMVNALLRASGDTRLVKEIIGHKPSEVWVGSGIGAGIGLLMTYTHWASSLQWLVDVPYQWEQTLYLVVFSILVALAIAARVVLGNWRKVKVTDQLKAVVGWSLAAPGFIGLFFSLMQFQTNNAGEWRLWPLLIVLAVLIAHTVLAIKFYRFIKPRYDEQVAHLKSVRKQQRQAQKKSRKNKRRKRK